MKWNEKIKVMILEIDHDKRRISLGLNKLNQILGLNLQINMVLEIKLKGSIKSITDFGIFVGLEGDIDGLNSFSDITEDEDPKKALDEF